MSTLRGLKVSVCTSTTGDTESTEFISLTIALRPSEKRFSTNEGAPGPPNRTREPRLTRCEMTMLPEGVHYFERGKYRNLMTLSNAVAPTSIVMRDPDVRRACVYVCRYVSSTLSNPLQWCQPASSYWNTVRLPPTVGCA